MIVMESKTLRVSKILKKSSAEMFADLKVGDTVKFSVDLKRAGRTGVHMLLI